MFDIWQMTCLSRHWTRPSADCPGDDARVLEAPLKRRFMSLTDTLHYSLAYIFHYVADRHIFICLIPTDLSQRLLSFNPV